MKILYVQKLTKLWYAHFIQSVTCYYFNLLPPTYVSQPILILCNVIHCYYAIACCIYMASRFICLDWLLYCVITEGCFVVGYYNCAI